MQTKINSAQRNRSRSRRKNPIPLAERAGLSPREFSELFGKQKVWAYRQIYRGRLQAITQFGRMLIPRSEVERILATAASYNGKTAERDSHQPKTGRSGQLASAANDRERVAGTIEG